MSAAVDRMWNIRDAILAWLYEEKAALRSPNEITAEQIQKSVDWSAEPMSGDELDRDAGYLVEEEYIRGIGTFGSRLPIRPEITPKGEKLAAEGVSVRPGPKRPAATTGVTNNYNFTNNGPSQNAINSSDFTQNQTIGESKDPFNDLADALDEYAAQGHEKADAARSMAEEIRDAAGGNEPQYGKLRTLLATAIGIGMTAAGHEIGQQINDLAMFAMQSIPV